MRLTTETALGHMLFKSIDEANAFSMPGGHIYVSRKLIALVQSEDEAMDAHRREQQAGRGDREHHGRQINDQLRVREIAEALLERQAQQKRREQLHPGLRDA